MESQGDMSTDTEAVQTLSGLTVIVSQDVWPKTKSSRTKVAPLLGFPEKTLGDMGPPAPLKKPLDLCDVLNKA